MSERREHPRIKGPFEGYWDGAVAHSGRIVDLSVTGCFLESVELPHLRQRVVVSLLVGGGVQDLPAEVVYAESNLGFAVRFLDVPAEVTAILEREIASRLPD